MFPPIWKDTTIFSETQDRTMRIFNKQLQELECEDPKVLFNETPKFLSKLAEEFSDADIARCGRLLRCLQNCS